jgi:uncharacterized protein YqjF (DUF2071 family)
LTALIDGYGNDVRIEPITAVAPDRIRVPSMLQRWAAVGFLHWPVDPRRIRSLLPGDLEVDTYEDRAWIGLVAFRMTMRLPFQPPIPAIDTYPEINVRTYVHDGVGRRGLWFLSLDVPRSAAVAVARVAFGLPYAWSRMQLRQGGDATAYAAARRPPWRPAATSIVVPDGPAIDEPSTELARFLTARFRLYGRGPAGTYRLAVEHEPWPLRRVPTASVDDQLMAAAGVAVDGPPAHVHVSEGVGVRVGWPVPLRSDRATPAPPRRRPRGASATSR